MNELLRKRAIEVLDRIMSHPSTKPFHSFSDPENPSGESSDLDSIRKKLTNNQYSKLQQWLDDVEKCWSTVEKRNADNPTKDSPKELILAAESRHLFEKEKRAIDILTVHNWGSELVRLRSKIFDTMNDPPPKIKTPASPFINSNAVKSNQPSAEELNEFVQESQMITSDEDWKEVNRIISEFQPDLLSDSPEIYLDASKLNMQTFTLLRQYFQTIIEKSKSKTNRQ